MGIFIVIYILSITCLDNRVWRCPMCQQGLGYVPNQYKCFCGKSRNPEWNRQDTPHSCGEVCGRKRNKTCVHRCAEYVLLLLSHFNVNNLHWHNTSVTNFSSWASSARYIFMNSLVCSRIETDFGRNPLSHRSPNILSFY